MEINQRDAENTYQLQCWKKSTRPYRHPVRSNFESCLEDLKEELDRVCEGFDQHDYDEWWFELCDKFVVPRDAIVWWFHSADTTRDNFIDEKYVHDYAMLKKLWLILDRVTDDLFEFEII
mgnify:CR=1 FL=1